MQICQLFLKDFIEYSTIFAFKNIAIIHHKDFEQINDFFN